VIGLTLGVLALLSGGGIQVRRGCIEFYGGLVKWMLGRMFGGDGVSAMTLGHTILGQTTTMLQNSRDHEHVHVRQYEHWGPFFLPAYFGSSLILWARGGDCYLDNPFEVEAYRVAAINPPDLKTGRDVATESVDEAAEIGPRKGERS
jgi:hypothetical protein